MHWIERGPEPAKLEPIRKTYTQPWIDFYVHDVGQKPTDARWREFRHELTEEFDNLCAYCEETDRGEVDHFRPKKLYPALVYAWSNWLFACRACNQAKSVIDGQLRATSIHVTKLSAPWETDISISTLSQGTLAQAHCFRKAKSVKLKA